MWIRCNSSQTTLLSDPADKEAKILKRKIDVSAAIILIVAAAFFSFAAAYFYMHAHFGEKTKLDETMDIIEQYYVGEYSRDELEEYAAAAMVAALGDRWSYYMSADDLKAYTQNLNNEYTGIGITIEKTEEYIRIVSVAADSPAAQQGLYPGGELRAVDGDSVAGLTSNEVKNLVQAGLETGAVKLSVFEDGVLNEYVISGTVIQIDPVRYELIDGIGYIKVKNFDAKSSQQIIDACDELVAKGAVGLVFDLRFNPGGQLSELLQALDYILPEGDIFLANVKGGERIAERSDAACLEIPMAVLVNSESYSAAEFFAAALQEYDWAVIVGEQTTGKGYAQITCPLSDGSAVHISAKEYYTPSGISLADVGIAPDLNVSLEEEQLLALYYDTLAPEDDAQLQAALEAVKAQMAN